MVRAAGIQVPMSARNSSPARWSRGRYRSISRETEKKSSRTAIQRYPVQDRIRARVSKPYLSEARMMIGAVMAKIRSAMRMI